MDLQHEKLRGIALEKLAVLTKGFNTYCSQLIEPFETAKLMKDFENTSLEGAEYKDALKKLKTYEQEKKESK